MAHTSCAAAPTGVHAHESSGQQLACCEDAVAVHAAVANLDVREGDVLGALHGAT
jgi:hypothetical protein